MALNKERSSMIVLFDADNDGDLDVYIASGGYEHETNADAYQDRFYVNDGKGNFVLSADAIPVNHTSKSCVRAADFDKDGDLDIFLGGRVLPAQYPKPVSSFIYRNETRNGVVKFTDVTTSVAKSLDSIGMVCDAAWTDFDNDGWLDLILAGEWMSIKMLKNVKGTFQDVSEQAGMSKKLGWWSSIAPGDFDNDGDMDYVVGNLGLNSYYKATEQNPARIYAKDFDNNGSYDAIPSLYLPATASDPVKKEFPAQTRDDIIKQLVSFRSKFQTYKSFAEATFDKLFTAAEFKDALVLEANNFHHSILMNHGDGKFQVVPLPGVIQYSCVNGMLAEDFDGDGNLDLLLTGNDYGTEVSVGRYDGCNGIFMKGNGKGQLVAASIMESGWFVPGNAKSLVKLRSGNGQLLLAAGQNRGPMKISRLNQSCQFIPVLKDDIAVVIEYADGRKRKQEINYGTSFLSQSSRFITVTAAIKHVVILNSKGNTRTTSIN
jgi:hypothetical protein